MAILVVKGISKTYGNEDTIFEALNDISFNVEKGEFLVILGNSGCGKSTLLSVLGGLDTVNDGEVIISGYNITTNFFNNITSFRRKNIGYIQQSFNLIDTLSVEKNIRLPIILDNKKVDESYFKKIIKFLDIENIIYRYPKDIKSGEKQRVCLARALIKKPLIIIADEPTGSLDKENSDNIMKLLKLANMLLGQTIILATHNEKIALVASRTIKMVDGKIESDIKKI